MARASPWNFAEFLHFSSILNFCASNINKTCINNCIFTIDVLAFCFHVRLSYIICKLTESILYFMGI